MKWILILLFIRVNTVFAKESKSANEEFIDYTVTIKRDDNSECEEIKDQLYHLGRKRWLNYLFEDLKNGKQIAYQYKAAYTKEDVFNYPLEDNALTNILVAYDTFYVYTAEDPEIPSPQIITYDFDIEKISKIKFIEKWTMHPKIGLNKKVIAFAPIIEEYDDYGTFIGEKILFWIKPEAFFKQKNEILISEIIEYNVPISKTTNQSINNWTENIINDVKTGKRTSYSYIWDINSYDTPKDAINIEDIKKMFILSDTVYVPDPIQSDLLTFYTIPHVSTEISSLVFREKWTIHPKDGLVKKIIAFCPDATIYGSDGIFFGNRKLFWIK